MIQHLVAFIKDESLDIAQGQIFVANKRIQTTWSADDDVGERFLVLEQFDIFLNWCATVEHCGFDFWEVFAEASIFVLDLVCKFSCMAHNQNRGLTRDGFKLMKGGQDEDRRLTKTGLGLTENVDTEKGLWDTFLLDCSEVRMLDLFSQNKSVVISHYGPSISL